MRPTDTLMSNNGPILHACLRQRAHMRQILIQPSVLTLHTQQECSWQDRKILTEYVKSKPILNSKQNNFKISQPFSPSDSRLGHLALQRKGIFQALYSQEHKYCSIKLSKLRDSTLYTYDIKVYLWKKHQHIAQIWQHHMPQWKN
jgi:hypothetical protein